MAKSYHKTIVFKIVFKKGDKNGRNQIDKTC